MWCYYTERVFISANHGFLQNVFWLQSYSHSSPKFAVKKEEEVSQSFYPFTEFFEQMNDLQNDLLLLPSILKIFLNCSIFSSDHGRQISMSPYPPVVLINVSKSISGRNKEERNIDRWFQLHQIRPHETFQTWLS